MAIHNKKTIELNNLIGQRIKDLRLAKGIACDELAKSLDVSFQQLCKYERGTNRITAGRLILIAGALDIKVGNIFEDIEGNSKKLKINEQQLMCNKIAQHFMNIKNKDHQNIVYNLVKYLPKNKGLEGG